MQKVTTVPEMRALGARFQREGRPVALVPTGGALHAGHAALIALAKARADVVVVCTFANPLAFGPSENFARYPRSPDADAKLCEDLKVDVVFAPSAEEMFPRGFSTSVAEETVSKPLCGISRPAHFRGVTTGLAKLLNIVQPAVLVLGQRDAQQVAVVRKMIADLCFAADVVVAPTVRESDGLAMSSRNRYLAPERRDTALGVYRALQMAMSAQRPSTAEALMRETLTDHGFEVDYAVVRDARTLRPVHGLETPCRALIAARLPEVRLIDNMAMPVWR